MLPSVRSFSYDVPTQAAEMEVMMKAESLSPSPVRTQMLGPNRHRCLQAERLSTPDNGQRRLRSAGCTAKRCEKQGEIFQQSN